MKRADRISPSVLVLLACLALALALTWPMVANFGTHVPGDGIDDPSLAWNLWWAKHALVDQPQNPFDARWQFWPVGINLAFYTLTLLNGALGIPLQAVFGPIAAYNLLLLSSFALSGVGAYLLCLDALRRAFGPTAARGRGGRTAAFLGAALYAFAAPKLFYAALGQGNIASSQWIPFAMLYIVRAALPGGRARDAALAGLFVVLQAYAELTYASFLALFAGLAALWGIASALPARENGTRMDADDRGKGRRRALARLVGRFALLAAITLLGLAPMLANMLPDLRAEGDLFASGGGFADLFSADLAGYLLPTQLHPVFGEVIRAVANDSAPRPDGSHMPVNKGQQVYVGYVALALAALAVARAWRSRHLTTGVEPSGGYVVNESNRLKPRLRESRGEVWFWVVSGLVFFVLTLGPSLRVLGYDLGIPLPFALVARLPFFEGNRYPSRYAVMLLASLAPLVALGIGDRAPGSTSHAPRITHHASRFMLYVALLFLALLFEHLSVLLPVNDLRVSSIYQIVAAEPGDFALLEMPPGWRNGARVAGKQDVVIMQQLWNQTAHGKRLLGGNTSRNPEFKFQYFSEDPTLSRLIAQTNAADVPQHDALRAMLAATPITEADRAQARGLAAFLDVRYVMVHREKMPPETEAALRDLLPLQLVAEEGSLALYRVAGELPEPRRFVVGSDAGRLALAEGWSPSDEDPRGGAPGASEPAPAFAQRGEASLLLPLPAGPAQVRLRIAALAPDQRIELVVDGRDVGAQTLPQTPGWIAFDVPADGARPPLSDVRLRFAVARPIADLAQTLSRAGPAGLLVRSAGEETGNFAHIYLNGEELSPGGRGYNLVALDPLHGELLDRATFDTHADPDAGAALAAWVAALPEGVTVAGAVKDEASMNLSEEAVAALRTLGVEDDLRGKFRWGHAFIGATGADPGSARSVLDGIRPAQVSFGLPLSEPQVAAQLWEVVVEPR